MRFPVTSLLLSLVTLAAPALPQMLPTGVRKASTVEGVTEYDFPNGLRALLFPDPSKPKITVNVTYLVGSRHEDYGETGMAHLLEHLLFKSTPSRPDLKKELTDHGAEWNGSTSNDRTNYFEIFNASDDNLKWALALEADRMVNARIEKAILDPEMTVVRNEFERGENSPVRALMQRTQQVAFDWHNYGKPVIGAKSDIENVPVERLAAFYRNYYQPDNAVLIVAGKFEEASALQWVSRTLGALPRPARELRRTYTLDPVQDGERTVTVRRVGDVQAVAMLFKTPAQAHPDSAALDVLATVLGDTPSGRLYKSLVATKKAVNASVNTESLREPGFLVALAEAPKESSLEDARATMLATIEGVVKQPPTKEEVERAKTRILKNIDLGLNDSQRVGLLLSESAAAGDWRLLYLTRDRVRSVTEADVLRVAKAYLKESNLTTGLFVPTELPDRAEIPATPDVSALLKDYKGGEALAQGEAFDPAPANVEARVVRSRLPNGLKLVLLPKKTRGGTVVAVLSAHFGDEKSVFGKSATAQLAGQLLMRGSSRRNRQEIQDEFDRLKARVAIGGAATGATASIDTLAANLPGALRMAAEVLRDPAFPESELELVRQAAISRAEQGRSEPQPLAITALLRHLNEAYPRGDLRYYSTPEEQIEDLKKVTLAEVRQFYHDFYGANNGELAVVGDFDPAAVQKLAAELFGDWKSPAAYRRIGRQYRKVEPVNRPIDTPDKQNAFFAAGLTFQMTDEDQDFPAMVLANYMFGRGQGTSRMWRRLREKDGFSYSANSMLQAQAQEDQAMLLALAIYAPQNGPKLEAAFREELASAVNEGFSSAEVAAAKASWLDEQKVQRTQDMSLARLLSAREYDGRTMSWDTRIEESVAALTPAQVNAAFRRRVDPAAASYVKAGDFKKAGVFQTP